MVLIILRSQGRKYETTNAQLAESFKDFLVKMGYPVRETNWISNYEINEIIRTNG